MKQTLASLILLTLMGITANAQHSGWVESTLASMTTEEKVGQLLCADLVAVYAHRESPSFRLALEWIRKYHVGGFIIAGGTVSDIATTTNALQGESKIPLIINADLEGGLWFHHPYHWLRGRAPELPRFVGGGGTSLPSLMAVGATGNARYAYEFGRITAIEARAVGIHWTNSPVADVNNNPKNPIVNTRSFGENPRDVAPLVEAYVRGAQDAGVMATLKHFPGHGDTEEDTHMMLPLLPFDRARLDSVEFVPFRAGVQAGVKAVMTAHIALPKVDPETRPSTLSPVMITDVLRKSIGFNGIVVTDGMTMQGVTDKYLPGEAAAKAIEAGVDVILVPEDLSKAYDGVLSAVKSGQISNDRLGQSVRRILAAKQWAGLDRKRFIQIEDIARVVGSPESESIADSMFQDAITLLRNNRNALPLKKNSKVQVISVTEDPDLYAGEALGEVLRGNVHSVVVSRLWNGSSKEMVSGVAAETQKADAAILGVYLSIGAWKGENKVSPTLQELLKKIGRLNTLIVTVAFGDPYVLGKLPRTDAMIAAYTGVRKAEEAVGRALLGLSPVQGKLPVTIPGSFKRGDGITLTPVRDSGAK